MPCPTFETLIEYADGRLPLPETSTVEKHVAGGCGDCRAALAWYAGFAATAREDASVEPPEWTTRRALAVFADAKEAAARRGLRGLVSRIRAALVFDSLAGAHAGDAVPARNAATASRQLLFSAVPFDIDLFVAEGDLPRKLVVAGQVLPIDGDDFESVRNLTVTVEHDGEAIAAAETSDFGEFTISGIAPGVYDLRLAGDDREILVSHTPLSLD